MGRSRRRKRPSETIRRRSEGALEDPLTSIRNRNMNRPAACRRGATFCRSKGWGVKSDDPLDRLVQSLIVERAAHGRELVAKSLGRRRRDVGVIRALVFPDFDHRKVIRPVTMLEHLEAHGT